MSEVTALITDRVLTERVRAALAGQYVLRLVRGEDELRAALRDRPVALVIVEAAPHLAVNVPALVRTVRAQHADVPIVGYCRMRPGLSTAVLDLAHAGVHDLVFAGVDDDQHRLIGLVGRAAHRSVVDDVLMHVAAAGAPGTTDTLLRAFLDAAARPHSVPEIARTLNVNRRTLFNRLEAVRLPGPQELTGWCRLVVAARRLDDPTHTIERVANDLEFSSANALRNLLQRHTGLSPTALRACGGYGYLRDRFVERMTRPAVLHQRARDRTRAVSAERRGAPGGTGRAVAGHRSSTAGVDPSRSLRSRHSSL